MYTKTYSPRKPNYVTIDGFEIPVLLPDMPKESEMRNYELPKLKQKFYIDPIPRDLLTWDSTRIEEFVAGQWHKRRNGEWWLIKGEPVYVTGPAWFFFNAWDCEKGGLPDFRLEAVEWWQVWDHCLMDHNCFGMLDFKCRRLGETEKALCAGYEFVTSYKKSRFGQQNRDDDAAYDNYYRIVEANQKMRPWFKPINKGNEAPEKRLHFTYPAKAVTHKSFNEDRGAIEFEDSTPALESIIDYEATKEKKYDSVRLRFYLGDEYGKIPPSRMKVLQQWNIIKQSLSINNERTIVGKAIIPSTIEDFENGETVKVCRDLWRQSDPNNKTETGRTISGLYRIFRGYENAADIDEWGFHKKEEARVFREAQIKAFLADGDLDGLTAFKRKQPASIEESLALPGNLCVLYPALLDMQKERLTEWAEHNAMVENVEGIKKYPLAVQGNFEWTRGFGSDVRFVPSKQGRFFVSGHPDTPNKRIVDGGRSIPGNTGMFAIGVDGIDHKANKGSDFAISVFRTFNPMAENALEYRASDFGDEITNKWQMKTNRFVCTYSNRPFNPDVAYEDCLKCSIYYGCPIFAERQKPGVMRYFERNLFQAYLLYKPSWVKVGAKREQDAGVHQSVPLTSIWSDLLKNHVSMFHETYVHVQQIDTFRSYNGENANECDQVVSSGLALVAARQYEIMYEREATVQSAPTTSFPWESYPINN